MKLYNTPRLQALLRWADWITADSESNMKPVAKRAIANALTNAYALEANALEDNALAKANAWIYILGNAYTLTNALAKAKANVLASALTNTNTNTKIIKIKIKALDDRKTLANAITVAIKNAHELKELKIFKEKNITWLIARLEALKAQFPKNNQPIEEHQLFASKIFQTYLKAFNLTKELINLSEAEETAMSNYCYANLLMVKCKESAVRVSPKTWAAIEERMLRVPNNG